MSRSVVSYFLCFLFCLPSFIAGEALATKRSHREVMMDDGSEAENIRPQYFRRTEEGPEGRVRNEEGKNVSTGLITRGLSGATRQGKITDFYGCKRIPFRDIQEIKTLSRSSTSPTGTPSTQNYNDVINALASAAESDPQSTPGSFERVPLELSAVRSVSSSANGVSLLEEEEAATRSSVESREAIISAGLIIPETPLQNNRKISSKPWRWFKPLKISRRLSLIPAATTRKSACVQASPAAVMTEPFLRTPAKKALYGALFTYPLSYLTFDLVEAPWLIDVRFVQNLTFSDMGYEIGLWEEAGWRRTLESMQSYKEGALPAYEEVERFETFDNAMIPFAIAYAFRNGHLGYPQDFEMTFHHLKEAESLSPGITGTLAAIYTFFSTKDASDILSHGANFLTKPGAENPDFRFGAREIMLRLKIGNFERGLVGEEEVFSSIRSYFSGLDSFPDILSLGVLERLSDIFLRPIEGVQSIYNAEACLNEICGRVGVPLGMFEKAHAKRQSLWARFDQYEKMVLPFAWKDSDSLEVSIRRIRSVAGVHNQLVQEGVVPSIKYDQDGIIGLVCRNFVAFGTIHVTHVDKVLSVISEEGLLD